MACSHSQSCPLFAQFQLNTTLRSWKIMYCDSDTRSKNCQRFKLSENALTVPLNLLPNGTMLDVGTGPSVGGGCGPSAPLPATAAVPRPEVAEVAAVTAALAATAAPVATAAAGHPATPPAARPEPATAPARPSAGEIARSIAPPPPERRRSILERIFGRRA